MEKVISIQQLQYWLASILDYGLDAMRQIIFGVLLAIHDPVIKPVEICLSSLSSCSLSTKRGKLRYLFKGKSTFC
jgi:hypothetical protein